MTDSAAVMPGRDDPIVPGHWAAFYEATGVPAAVREGRVVHVSGHTGVLADDRLPDDPAEQIRQTFRNVGATLAAAGVGWPDVIEMSSYSVGLSSHGGLLVEIAREFLDRPLPAWTAAGVTELFEPGAVFELRCRAVDPG